MSTFRSAPSASSPADSSPQRDVVLPQYSAGQVLGIWALVTAPMGVLAFVVAPWVADRVDLHAGLVHWIAMVVGMMWQFVVSLGLLRREGPLDWATLKRRIRANPPRDPRTGVTSGRLWWWVLPAILANVLLGLAAAGVDSWWGRLTGLSEPAYANISALADRQFAGQWWILGLALVSSLFNYVLGEELIFRGVLLPRMRGAFGRADWVVNTVLFGLYHVHKIWFWPSMIVSSFGIAWAAGRYRSFWMGVIVHGVEGLIVVGAVTAVVAGWYP